MPCSKNNIPLLPSRKNDARERANGGREIFDDRPVIDGPPHEAVHLEYAEEVRAGETGAWREKIPAPSPTWPHTLSLRGRQDSDYIVRTAHYDERYHDSR